MKKERQIHLLTADGERLEREGRAQLYPRPHLERDSFFSLDGIWDLEIRDRRGHLTNEQIRVPFVPQSRLSGVKAKLPPKAMPAQPAACFKENVWTACQRSCTCLH